MVLVAADSLQGNCIDFFLIVYSMLAFLIDRWSV